MSTKHLMSAAAMDLKRMAIGYHRGSIQMGDLFYGEARKCIGQLEYSSLKPYMQKKIDEILELSHEADKNKKAELALMYSTIVQNYCLKYCS